MMRLARWLAVAWLIQGCATLSDQPVVSVPVIYQSAFSECAPRDGAANLVVLRQGAILGSGDAEWIAKPGDFTLEMLDPLGRNLLKLKHSQRSLSVSGSLVRKIPRIALGPDGFLQIGGQWIGLRAAELPCVFSGVLPKSWLLSVRKLIGQQLIAADADRTIEIVFDSARTGEKWRFCAKVAWGGFAWYRHELNWCQQGAELSEGLIAADHDISVRIVQHIEQER